ncbi:MAG TPA: tetratricopeptide repeat protein [Candidatus Krumholzibacteria bacterium]|nr:tetratricopeptide repeat protein [Candidatus Krumholzibacteria bacterium]
MRFRRVAIAALLLLAAVALILVKRQPHSSGPATYVGSAACAPCHAQEDADWRTSDHFLAMQEPNRHSVLGDFEHATFTGDGHTSTFFRRDSTYVVNTTGPDGNPHDYPVRYTFGVYPLQQYLLELPGGRLQAFGVAWDSREKSEGGQRWFSLYPDQKLAPGDPLFWTGIDQTWNYQCAECHSTDVRRGYDPATRTYHTTFHEINVSCESCHGPGSAHVAWAHRAGKKEAEPGESMGLPVRYRDRADNTWTIDPVSGIAHRSKLAVTHDEVEACAYCHSRRGLLKEGHVPGRPIGDTHRVALLEPDLYHADGQILGEVYEYGSFLQSKMYRAGVTCSDCHQPHTDHRYAEGNELCARCHLATKFDTPEHHHHPAGSAGARCVSCHMLQRTYMGVDARRDHSFRVPRPDLTVELGTPSTCTDCHADHDARWSRDAFMRWWGNRERPHYARALSLARAGAPDSASALSGVFNGPLEPAIVRATALEELSRGSDAHLPAAVTQGAADESPLVREAAAAASQTLPAEMRIADITNLLSDPVLSVRIQAGRALCDVPAQSLTNTTRAQRDSALAEYRRTQLVNADRPESWFNLGTLEAQLGHFDAAERDYHTAIEVDSTWEPAYVNLADVLRVAGRDDEGERVLRAGIKRLPNGASLYHALGLLQVRAHHVDEAVASLKRASELAPGDARFAYVYAVAVMDSGGPTQALRIVRTALERSPYDADLKALRAQLEQPSGRR